MKKFILAAALIAPLAGFAPAFAEDGSAGLYVERPAATYSSSPREFTARDNAVRPTRAERNQINNEAVPSSVGQGL